MLISFASSSFPCISMVTLFILLPSFPWLDFFLSLASFLFSRKLLATYIVNSKDSNPIVPPATTDKNTTRVSRGLSVFKQQDKQMNG